MKHRHIPIEGGHITWNGKEAPTKEQLETLETIAKKINNQSSQYYEPGTTKPSRQKGVKNCCHESSGACKRNGSCKTQERV